MYYEWKVCNSKEIADHKFPYLEKTLILQGFFNQQYRLWMTVNGISLYQPGAFVVQIPFESAGKYISYDKTFFYKIEKLDDGTYDLYQGQVTE